MKVVYSVAASLGGGGIGRDTYEAVKGLYENNYLQKVVVYKNKQKQIPKKYIKNVRFHPTKIFSNLPARYYYPVKRKYLDWITKGVLQKGADVFHGWSSGSLQSLKFCRENGIISFLENPGPHFKFVESLIGPEYEEMGVARINQPEFFKNFFGQDQDYHAAEHKEASYIILESDFTYQTFLSHGLPKEKLLIVPRGVDIDRFVPPRKKENKKFRAIFVGAICIRKGVRYLLEAWSDLGLKDAELILLGQVRAEISDIVKKHVSNNSNIKVMGHIADPIKFFQDASVFVFPSLSEGSAKVTYEAMSCGLPVILTPNAGSVAKDREHGFIVPAQNKEAIHEKILYLFENQEVREEMGQNARKHMESYTWDNHRKLLISIYEKAFTKKLLSRESNGVV